jgi:hypothetical protein
MTGAGRGQVPLLIPRRRAGALEKASAQATARAALAELLRRPRYEVFPSSGIEDGVAEHLSPDVKVTVTSSPSRGIETTLQPTSRGAAPSAAASGYSRETTTVFASVNVSRIECDPPPRPTPDDLPARPPKGRWLSQ